MAEEAAIANRRVLQLTYESLTEWETIETELQPYRLLFSQHSCYVLGRSSMHGEVRTFNLDHFKSFKALSQAIHRSEKLQSQPTLS